MAAPPKPLAQYAPLGRTGLKVSRLALGAMTFGTGDKDKAQEIFRKYREAGGNFIDTADRYAGGKSEEWLGEFVEADKCRDAVVIATKFGFCSEPGNPNAGGNGRKNILRAVEASLKRLRTSYIDLYFLHVYDLVTPVEEVVSTLNDLVRSGKVLYIGLSNVPAWYAARAQTIAELRGYEQFCVFQLEYSLASRVLEREHLPLAQQLGMSLLPWSPLASGMLTGKYRRGVDGVTTGEGRIVALQGSGNPLVERFTKNPKNWLIVEAVVESAQALKVTPAEVAIAWVLQRPNVTSLLIGATKLEQLVQNINALQLKLPADVVKRLDDISAPEETALELFWGPFIQGMANGGVPVVRNPTTTPSPSSSK